MRYLTMFCAIVLASVGGSAWGAIANFDSYEEGYTQEAPFTDGGITFCDLDWRINDPTWPSSPPLVIDNVAGARFENSPFVSRPNVLTCWAWSEGGVWLSRWGEMKMTTGSVETFASLELFASLLPDELGNTITLEAIRDGNVVTTDSVLQELPWDQHYTLSVSGVEFDTLRLVGSGDFQDGCFFACIDNVVITPEPATFTLLALSALMLRRRG